MLEKFAAWRRRARRSSTPRGLLAALITSARMRGVLHAAQGHWQHAAAIRTGSDVGLVTMTLDGRVVWLPRALSSSTHDPHWIDLTDLPLVDALTVVFRRPQAV